MAGLIFGLERIDGVWRGMVLALKRIGGGGNDGDYFGGV